MEITIPKWNFTKEYVGGGGMPYLDTFKWINIKTGVFTNYKPDVDDPSDMKNIYTMVSTNGRLYGYNYLAYSEMEREYNFDSEVIYLDYLGKTCDYGKVVKSKVLKRVIHIDHAIKEEFLNDYLFSDEYNKFNDKELIEKSILAKKEKIEKERKIRVDFFKKTMPSYDKYFKENFDFAKNLYNDYMNPSENEGKTANGGESDGTSLGNDNKMSPIGLKKKYSKNI